MDIGMVQSGIGGYSFLTKSAIILVTVVAVFGVIGYSFLTKSAIILAYVKT
ncbi:hypothetical protein CMALT430_10089 [Carnobacterium maltaromaticum]|nr:hypothetical protein CMALT430_10089 [Carnobacterium maltaromaticum]